MIQDMLELDLDSLDEKDRVRKLAKLEDYLEMVEKVEEQLNTSFEVARSARENHYSPNPVHARCACALLALWARAAESQIEGGLRSKMKLFEKNDCICDEHLDVKM